MVSREARVNYKNAVAEFFDARTDYNRSEVHYRVAGRLVELGAPRRNEQILDIATGTGFVAILTARLVGESVKVVGVDISAGMLKQAKQAVAAAGLNNIELVRADAEFLNYADGSFDLIFCCNALAYMSDVPGALRQWHSLLRPGGRLAFNCWAEQSYVNGRLLRDIAVREGIQVSMIGQRTGTPERCCAVLAAAGFDEPQVVVEPTRNFFSVDHLATVLDSQVKNPLYGIAPCDAVRLTDLRDEYISEARSPSVMRRINEEMGAYFVLAIRPCA